MGEREVKIVEDSYDEAVKRLFIMAVERIMGTGQPVDQAAAQFEQGFGKVRDLYARAMKSPVVTK